MVVLYQIIMFLIVIIASFGGVSFWLAAVIFTAGFSLTNIFSVGLLLVQGSTIIVASLVGFFIALCVSLCRVMEKIPDWWMNNKKYIKSGFDPISFLFYISSFGAGYIIKKISYYLIYLITFFKETNIPGILVSLVGVGMVLMFIFGFLLAVIPVNFVISKFKEKFDEEKINTLCFSWILIGLPLYIIGMFACQF